MTEGISPNKLNDISKVYLDTIYKHNTGENKIDQEREKWSKSAETQKEGYKGTADLSKADPAAKKKVEDRIEKWAGKRVPGGKEGVKESLSNWRTDLREISDAIPETEKKTEKEVTEKKVKNKIEINPKISEAVAEMGGEVLSVEEQTAPVEEDPAIKAKEKRQAMIKKQVLNKKLQAVRQGAGQDIVASYDPEGKAIAENALEKRAKENEKARKWLKKDAKDSGYTDIALKASMSKGAGVSEAKEKKKHNCASKVKHEEYGMGRCIKEMHTLDEDGQVTHYDVMFSNKIIKNIPVSSLEIIEGKFHEHYINYEKNVEVVNELFGVMGAAATKKKGTSKPQNVTFGGNKTDKRKGPVPDTKMKDYKGSPSYQKMMAKRKEKVSEEKEKGLDGKACWKGYREILEEKIKLERDNRTLEEKMKQEYDRI